MGLQGLAPGPGAVGGPQRQKCQTAAGSPAGQEQPPGSRSGGWARGGRKWPCPFVPGSTSLDSTLCSVLSPQGHAVPSSTKTTAPLETDSCQARYSAAAPLGAAGIQRHCCGPSKDLALSTPLVLGPVCLLENWSFKLSRTSLLTPLWNQAFFSSGIWGGLSWGFPHLWESTPP